MASVLSVKKKFLESGVKTREDHIVNLKHVLYNAIKRALKNY
jgi:hypothetical protein